MNRPLFAAAALAAAVTAAGAAGRVEVSYVDPDRYSDAGRGSVERERTMASFNRHFEQLAQRLPDGQTLQLAITDIDLAGETWPRAGHELRVLRGRADGPRLALRYTLLEGSRSLKSGQASLADLGYLFSPPAHEMRDDLPYEKRMLRRWFEQNFVIP